LREKNAPAKTKRPAPHRSPEAIDKRETIVVFLPAAEKMLALVRRVMCCVTVRCRAGPALVMHGELGNALAVLVRKRLSQVIVPQPNGPGGEP
jgi:hypothetical protein